MPLDAPKRILVVSPNWVGDALFSTPALRTLKKHWPSAKITCLGPPRIEPVLRRNPHLDGFIAYDDKLSLLKLPAFVSLVARLRREGFDTAILLHRSKTKALLTRLAGIPQRMGYAPLGHSRGLTLPVEPSPAPQHKIDHYLALLVKAGIAPDGRHMDFIPDEAARPALEALLRWNGVAKGDRYAVVHAGGNWDLKRWPAGHFIEAIRLIIDRLGCKAVLVGTASEQGLADEILSHFDGGKVVSLCGKTSLDGLALLLKDAAFVLSNDSGPIHLAATQKAPIIGLFGPTSPALTGPVSLAPMRILRKDAGCAVPCYFRTCEHRVCMEWVQPQEVLEAARELLHA